MSTSAATLSLTPAEVRAIHLWRRLGFGQLTLTIQNGEPVMAEAVASFRLDKAEWPGAVEAMARAAG